MAKEGGGRFAAILLDKERSISERIDFLYPSADLV
jgi:hypothetical protein